MNDLSQGLLSEFPYTQYLTRGTHMWYHTRSTLHVVSYKWYITRGILHVVSIK